MEEVKKNFYLVYFEQPIKGSKKTQRMYCQFLASSAGSNYGYTPHPDYGKRFQDWLEAAKFMVDYYWDQYPLFADRLLDIVVLNMPVDQRSWAQCNCPISQYEEVELKKIDKVTYEEYRRYSQSKQATTISQSSPKNADMQPGSDTSQVYEE